MHGHILISKWTPQPENLKSSPFNKREREREREREVKLLWTHKKTQDLVFIINPTLNK